MSCPLLRTYARSHSLAIGIPIITSVRTAMTFTHAIAITFLQWQQPPLYVKKHLATQIQVQTPPEDTWAQVAQPEWTRPGFAKSDE